MESKDIFPFLGGKKWRACLQTRSLTRFFLLLFADITGEIDNIFILAIRELEDIISCSDLAVQALSDEHNSQKKISIET